MSDLAMNESERVIENMDIPDKNKSELYNVRKEMKENYLERVGELIVKNVEGEFNPYVEHTNQGLNLRIVTDENIEDIIAIGKFFELELIENERTNPDSGNAWIRFRF